MTAVGLASGPARVRVATSVDGGGMGRELEAQVVASGAWQRVMLPAAALADTIEIRWDPTDAAATLSEVEVWAEGSPSEHVAGASLASEIVADPARYGRVTSAVTDAIVLSPHTFARDRRAASARFRVARPSRCVRAFLRYELFGAADVAGLARTLNGVRIDGASSSRRGDGLAIVAEEIPRAALRDGDNEIAFEPARDATPATVRVQRLDVVCVEDPARARDDGALSAAERASIDALTDGVNETRVDVRSRNDGARWVFGVASQVHRVSFFALSPPSGRLELATGVGRTTSRVAVPLAGLRHGWNHVDVPSSLVPAESVIVRFVGGREAAGAVSELHIAASPLPVAHAPRVVITHPGSNDCVGSSVYVRGFVEGLGRSIERAQLELGSVTRSLSLGADGSFATTVSGQFSGEAVTVRAVFDSTSTSRLEAASSVSLDRCPTAVAAPYAHTVADNAAPFGQWVRPESASTIEYAGVRIEVPEGAVERPVRLTIRPVDRRDVPALDSGLDNVTKDGRAFRFGPHGIVFKKPLRISVPWSGRSLPAGMREDDVNVYYYDVASRRWRDVPRLAGPGQERVLAATNHFTDYIAATRSMPETPQAAGFDGNTIRGIRDANPLAGVPTIAAPSANPNGSAATSFPIDTPSGRNGIEPSLSIDYSSDTENGWLGVGWGLNSSAFEVDIRNGVPAFAMEDLETYRLDGAALVCTGPARGDKDCHRRVDGDRDVIRRRGTWPNDLRWEVVRDGVTYSYGLDDSGRLTSPYTVSTGAGSAAPSVRWYLQRVEDLHGNFMLYEYAPDDGTRPGSASVEDEPFRQKYLAAIHYTGHRSGATVDVQPNYHVSFSLDASRPDVSSSARFGFEVLTRRRLGNIEIKSGGTVVRRYALTYLTGDFSKSLLEAIEQRSAENSVLFRYSFDYHRAPSNGNGGVAVGAGTLWSTAPATHELATHGGLRGGGSGFVGIGPPPPVITGGVGLSASFGESQSRNTHADFNGDGLGDLLAVGSPAHTWLTRFGSRSGGTLLGHTLPNNPSEFTRDPSESLALSLSIQGPLGMAAAGLEGTVDFGRAQSGFFDADGDGWIDHLSLEPVGGGTAIGVRLNPYRLGRSSFGVPTGSGGTTPDYFLSGLENHALEAILPPALADRLGPQLYSTAPIVRWVAPCAGNVRIVGAVSRPGSGGTNIRATIFRGTHGVSPSFEPIWQRTLSATDGPCVPSGSGDCGTGRLLEVKNADRLYFVVESLGDIVGDDTLWAPQIEYSGYLPNHPEPRHACTPTGNGAYVVSCVGALRESDAYGPAGNWAPAPPMCTAPIATAIYNRATDFRVAADNVVSWTSQLAGTVNLAGTITMSAPATLQIVLRRSYFTNNPMALPPPEVAPPWDGTTELTPAITDAIAAAQTATTTTAIATIPLFAGVNTISQSAIATTQGAQLVAYINVGGADPAIVQNFAVNAAMTHACVPPNFGDTPVCFAVGPCAPVAGAPAGSQSLCPLVTHPHAQSIGESIVRGSLVPAIGFQPLSTVDSPAPVSFVGWYRGWSVLEWNDAQDFSESAARESNTAGVSPAELERRILQLSASTPVTPPIPAPSFLPFVAAPLGTSLQRPSGVQVLTEPVWRGSGIDSFVSATTLKPSSRSKFRVGPGRELQTIAGYASLALAGPSLRASSGIHIGAHVGLGIANAGGSRGAGQVQQEFYDVNGDRLPDSVTWSSGGGMRVQFLRANYATSPPTFTFAPSVPFDLRTDSLRQTIDVGSRMSAGLGTLVGLATPERKSDGWIEGVGTPTPSWGDTMGRNATDNTLADINGDGLLDHLRLVVDNSEPGKVKSAAQVQFNLGYRLSRTMLLNARFGHWEDSAGVPLLRTGFETEVNKSNSRQFGVYGTGAGNAETERRTLTMLVDVTGDGLVDHVQASESGVEAEWLVSPNVGDGFGAAQRWTLGAWVPAAEVPASATNALSRSEGNNFNGSIGGVVELPLAVVRLSFQGSLSLNSSSNHTTMTLTDVNGDGLVDHVAQTGDGRIFARLNPIGASNRLAVIHNPQGGRIELSYEAAGNVAPSTRTTPDGVSHSVHMPRSQWVLSRVQTWDSASVVPTPGHHTSTSFDYHQSGFYDVAERESYGFGHITVTATDGARTELYFHNQDYYRRGRGYASFSLDGTNHVWTRSSVAWSAPSSVPALTGSYSPRKDSETSYVLDGTSVFTGSFSSIHPVKTVTKTFTYRSTGEVESITDPGDDDGNDDLRVEITYKDFAALNLALPEMVTIRSLPSLAILRQRRAIYRANATLEYISDRLVGGVDPDTGDAWVGDPARDPTSRFEFDAFGNIKETKDPSGFITTVQYDTLTRSRPIEVSNSFGLRTTTQYDDRWGAPIVQTDTNDQQVIYAYDSHGRLESVRGPYDHSGPEPTIRFSYSLGTGAAGSLWARTDHKDSAHPLDPITTVLFVDGFGRVSQTKRETDAEQFGVVEHGYSVSGVVTYDLRGRVVEQGQPWFSGAPATDYAASAIRNPTLTTYDFLDRPLTVTTPDGATTTTSYGHAVRRGVDRLTVTVTDPLSRTATSYRRIDGQVTDLHQVNTINGVPTDLWTTYLYTELGQLSTVTDAATKPHSTTATYDSLGRMIALDNPDTGLVEYRYTASGDLGAKITPNHRAISPSTMIRYLRNWHRLHTVDNPTSTDVTFTYGTNLDPAGRRGRLVSRTDDSGLHEFVYGALGEITATHVELEPEAGVGTTIADTYFTYDSFGRLRSVRYPDNELVEYEYDRGGLLRRVTGDRGSGPFEYVSELRYDEFGQRTLIEYGNGVTTRYNSNALTRRMDSLETDSPVAGALQRLNYTYQPDGNIAGIWTSGVGGPAPNLAQVWQSFDYDELNQLTDAWGYHTRDGGAEHSYSLSMSYDRIHNITTKTQTAWATPGPGGSWAQVAALTHNFNYQFDSSRPHAATKVGGRPIDYDANGNQTFTQDPNTGAVRSMVWDDDDRLLQVVDPSSTVSFRYDSSGTRTHKVSSSGVTVYVNQYYTVRNAAIATKHVFAGAQRVASVLNTGSSEKTSYLHTNHLGSTEFVTGDLGHVQEHHEQLPFGESWVEETGGATVPTPYRFTGKELDEETGLYYFGARHYDPATGLWLSADPAMRDYATGNSRSGGFGSPANLNAYGYGWNSPLRMTDPDGREVSVLGRIGTVACLSNPGCRTAVLAVTAVAAVGVSGWGLYRYHTRLRPTERPDFVQMSANDAAGVPTDASAAPDVADTPGGTPEPPPDPPANVAGWLAAAGTFTAKAAQMASWAGNRAERVLSGANAAATAAFDALREEANAGVQVARNLMIAIHSSTGGRGHASSVAEAADVIARIDLMGRGPGVTRVESAGRQVLAIAVRGEPGFYWVLIRNLTYESFRLTYRDARTGLMRTASEYGTLLKIELGHGEILRQRLTDIR